jgi:glycine/D-amino acid oxidase-like deaminating enzyme
MLSYWEQQSFTTYDHIVIGAGIVGLNTAIELRGHYPSARILVLERGLLPSGASSRNAGFACMGSVTELLDDLEVMSEAEVFGLFEWRKKGLERLRSRLGDKNIGYEENGSHELINEKEAGALDKLEYLNQLLLPITQKPAFALANERIQEFGFAANYTTALIENTCEGELHSGKMLSVLTALALRSGIEVRTGAEVTNYEEEARCVRVELRDRLHDSVLDLRTQTLTLCTNAFTKQLLPAEDIAPGRGQVLITQPMEGLRFKGIFHFDKGYYYFREIDGRILIGGGRNMDFAKEATTSFELNEEIQLELERKLHEIVIPGRRFLVELRWAGIMAFGPNKYPVVKSVSDRVFGAFRMGGMGVALGSEVAAQVADMIRAKH